MILIAIKWNRLVLRCSSAAKTCCWTDRVEILVRQYDLGRGYKLFFMLNSAEHEILNAHKYDKVKKFSIFSG